jgi:hypothetical protein
VTDRPWVRRLASMTALINLYICISIVFDDKNTY